MVAGREVTKVVVKNIDGDDLLRLRGAQGKRRSNDDKRRQEGYAITHGPISAQEVRGLKKKPIDPQIYALTSRDFCEVEYNSLPKFHFCSTSIRAHRSEASCSPACRDANSRF